MKQKGYKVVSASAAGIETVAKPAVKHSHKIMIEGSRQIHLSMENFLDSLDNSTKNKITWVTFTQLFKGLKKVNRGFHSLVKQSITYNYQESIQTLQIIESGLNCHQNELEEYFRQNNIDVHENWAFSQENRETIRELTAFIKENTRDCKDIPYHRVWQYFIAFACIQKKARELIWRIKRLEMTPYLIDGVNDMKYFSRFAVGIYGKLLVSIIIEKKWTKIFKSESDEEILMRYAKFHSENLIYSHIKSKKYLPGHAIVRDPLRKALVLVIRGTMSVFDCMTDLKGDYSSYDYVDPYSREVIASGLVHSGILTCAKNLNDEIKEKVLEYLKIWPDYTLYVVGHSLGAGASALLGLIWMSDPEIMTKGFKAIAYAPPAVVSSELNEYLKQNLFSCVYGNDLVSRLSFGAVRDLCEMILFFHSKEKTSDGPKASEITSNFLYRGKVEEQKYIQLYQELQASFKSYKLETPGNLYQMYNTEKHSDSCLLGESDSKSTYVGSFVDPSYLSEIVFSKTMVNDHMPNFYEQALEYLASSQPLYHRSHLLLNL
jgi:Lipase (class 3)